LQVTHALFCPCALLRLPRSCQGPGRCLQLTGQHWRQDRDFCPTRMWIRLQIRHLSINAHCERLKHTPPGDHTELLDSALMCLGAGLPPNLGGFHPAVGAIPNAIRASHLQHKATLLLAGGLCHHCGQGAVPPLCAGGLQHHCVCTGLCHHATSVCRGLMHHCVQGLRHDCVQGARAGAGRPLCPAGRWLPGDAQQNAAISATCP
jgi:hypothetical protein